MNLLIKYEKTVLPGGRTAQSKLAAEAAANLAENLPDGAATGVAVGVTREEKHLADLLIRIVSRGQDEL